MTRETVAANDYDVIVLGGGAAGLMCAATAGYRGRRVLIVEHANKVGKKILMSGGGRCNFTNLDAEPKHFLSDNLHFCKSALKRYSPLDFIELVERHQLSYTEKAIGQLFCNDSAKDLLNILLKECEYAKVDIQTKCALTAIRRRSEGGFCVETTSGVFNVASLVVATGGLSIPTMGATGKGYEIAKQFSLQCTETRASLVPLTLKGHWLDVAKSLSGVAVDVVVSFGPHQFAAPLLFTHRGLSGPAILQISNYWSPGEPIRIDFLPGRSLDTLLKQWWQAGKQSELKNVLCQWLPKRFVQCWLETALTSGGELIGNKIVHQYSPHDMQQLTEHFQRFSIVPSGTEGYRTAEVTLGGVGTDEVSSKTFEAKKVPGLYFIGEVLDVTGWLGGYNFQWAWSSGYCAGQYV